MEGVGVSQYGGFVFFGLCCITDSPQVLLTMRPVTASMVGKTTRINIGELITTTNKAATVDIIMFMKIR